MPNLTKVYTKSCESNDITKILDTYHKLCTEILNSTIKRYIESEKLFFLINEEYNSIKSKYYSL